MASLRQEGVIPATTSWSLDAHPVRDPRHIHHSSEQETTMTQSVRNLRSAPAAATVLGMLLLATPAAFAEDGLKASPREQEYSPEATVQTAPSPQIYEYNVGITDMGWHATGQLPVPQQDQSAHVIYQMVPGGLRYHRMQ
jgi:hypothetical protein